MYPKAYIDYLVHFHGDRDYFECHELLEEYWKDHDPGNKNSVWAAFIQLAVGSYHFRRGNIAGSSRTLNKALASFKQRENELARLGLNKNEFLSKLEAFITTVETGRVYQSFVIPIHDPSLKEMCMEACLDKGFDWCKKDYTPSADIIDRHKSRDRSSVIFEREMALKKKHGSKEPSPE
ncbi:DUF309 domain-containing protein [Bacillus sp. B-jedd]|uniref:DUF309 domain-containing protein n=1 Tax=Bacillus sp. B-jedd TaxID=1476857 RepID=UPI00051562C4|nr:DUF309 domain-containing protein [Bacillus sp. B-jedd]CEG27710.1 SMC interacting protein [Bacillus sp. B-jedd]